MKNFANRYLVEHASIHKKPSTAAEDSRLLKSPGAVFELPLVSKTCAFMIFGIPSPV